MIGDMELMLGVPQALFPYPEGLSVKGFDWGALITLVNVSMPMFPMPTDLSFGGD